MIIVKGRCYRCGGNLFGDEEDGTVRCLACSCYVSSDANSLLVRDRRGFPKQVIRPTGRMFDNLK
jgi:hypothetical protein